MVDGNDVLEVYTIALELIAFCRNGGGPALIEAKTYRMRGHGEYDHQHYVDKRTGGMGPGSSLYEDLRKTC